MGLASDFLKRQASQFVDRGINSLLGGIFGGPQEAGSGFSVNRMVSSLDKSGIAPSSHFEVYIFGGKNVGDERDMAFRVDTIDLPGRNFAPIDHKFTNMGPVNRIPGQQFYSDVTATILLSEDLREKDYFEWWHEKIVNTGAFEASSQAKYDALNAAAETAANENLTAFEPIANPFNASYTASPFTHKYFDNYVGRVEIRQYGVNGELRSIHTLNEAYPLSIAPISMSWSSEEAAKMQVTFGYRNYKAVFNKQNQPGMGFGFSFSLGKGGLKLGARLPGIGNIGFARGAGITANLGGLSKKIFG